MTDATTPLPAIPGVRLPGKVVHYPCEAGCERVLHLEGYGWPAPEGGIALSPRLRLEITGTIAPAPLGCIMPVGDEWVLVWFDEPRGAKPVADAASGALQLGNRAQLSGPYALCGGCIARGGKT